MLTVPNGEVLYNSFILIDDIFLNVGGLRFVRSIGINATDKSKETNIKFYNLLSEFFNITGVPILINTSFNVRGEPIVCSPKDAFNCFMGTNLDMLVCNNVLLYKDEQNKEKFNKNFKDSFID